MRKLCVFLSVIAAMGVFVLFASTARAAMNDWDFIKLCKRGSLEEIQAAIKGGANVNAKDSDGWTVLMAAAFNANPEMISLLLESGADVNAKDSDGATALMSAADKGNPEVISLLLESGADVNAKHYRGITALMRAANRNKNPEVILILLENGADINAKTTDDGETALMLAAGYNKNPEVVSVLLENGADAAITDNEGEKAIDYMKEPDENSSGEYKSAYQSLKNASK
jgi:ankyrin repeat protein